MKELKQYAIQATDGIVGHVKDFYFDDRVWVIRYLVVETGSWLSSRKVLISPVAVGTPDWSQEVLPVAMTMDQVKDSPDIDTDKPVSRQHEIQYLGYYGYPYYWDGTGLWGDEMYPNMAAPGATLAATAGSQDVDNPHLRSFNAVTGYSIEATDGDIGHVQGLLVDEETWAIRYMVVNTSNWWLGHQVLVAPQWIQSVSWPDSTVSVNLTRQAVQNAPAYDPSLGLDRAQEISTFNHYGRAGYWAEQP
jgi:hypothetical protein